MTHPRISTPTLLAYWHTIGFSQRVLRELREHFCRADTRAPSLSQVISYARTLWHMRANTFESIATRAESLSLEAFAESLQRLGVSVLLRWDPLYPVGLLIAETAPEVLYYQWNIKIKGLPIAVVGARELSSYGISAVRAIIPELVRAGCTIVSGGALGTDAEAHEVAVGARGHTIAVLGSGLDLLYPSANKRLFARILESGGALVSEFPLGTQAAPYTFPVRNQTIALMSRGTLVIEARERSGSLITAQAAIEAGRDVFAIPWDIGRYNSRGTNALIRSGSAKLVMEATDIISEYPELAELRSARVQSEQPPMSPEHAKVVAALRAGKGLFDEILHATELSAPALTQILSALELTGAIERGGGGRYREI